MAGEGFIGLDEFKAKLLAAGQQISGPFLRDALWAGAEVFRGAIESATPIGKAEYTYTRDGRTIRVKNPRVGQAMANVIIYQRRISGMSQDVADLSLLIGYEKAHAWYMYFYEYGNRHQAPHPVVRPVYDSLQDEALQAAQQALTNAVGGLS